MNYIVIQLHIILRVLYVLFHFCFFQSKTKKIGLLH